MTISYQNADAYSNQHYAAYDFGDSAEALS